VDLSYLTNPQAWLMALGIFALRISDMSLDTIRVLFVVRGKKGLAWILGAMQSTIFVVAISTVLAHLDNPLNVLGYATGFGTGIVVGMLIEERLAIGHIHLTIISSTRGTMIAESLRTEGYAVTEIPARGKNGMVSVLHCDVLRKKIDQAETIALEADPEAFITAEDVRPVRRGFWRS
jgi:uncharacterized protein YebE (UPF0316 family)